MIIDNTSPCQNILENNSAYIDSLYVSCFENVKKMVVNNSGTEDDAHDVFQNALMVLFQNCKKEDFILSCKPCTFLMSVSRKRWMSELGRKRKSKNMLHLAGENIAYEDDLHMQRERILAKYFSLLEEGCRRILQLSVIEGIPGKLAAKQLQLSYEYFRVAKKRCLDKFFNDLNNDSQWNDLKS